MNSRKKFTVAAVVVVAAFAISLVVAEDDWDEPEPEIESVGIVESGCHDDVRALSANSASGGLHVGTINGTSPDTEVSAEIRLVSPERAEITSYRLDVETHNETASASGYDCEGAIKYRVEYDAPYDATGSGLRVETHRNGELRGCGGSTSGPDIGCARLHEDVTTHWSNESTGE